MNTNVKPFTPYLKRLTESRDLESLSNIDSWCKKMSSAYQQNIKSNLDIEPNKTLSWIFNAYPLILAYQGKTAESEVVLKKIINFWSNSHKKQANTEKLKSLIDPSVNLARLHRLTRNNKFWPTFNKINRFSNEKKIKLGGFTIGEAELQERWRMLEVISLDEQLKTYISESRFEEVLNLKDLLSEKDFLGPIYLESKIIAHLALQEFEQAEVFAKQGMQQTNCIKRGVYLYRLYESFKGQNKHKDADLVMKHLISKLEQTPLNNLTKLTFSSRIIEEANLKPNYLLVEQTLKQYQLIHDEFNYGMLLCHLYSHYPDDNLKTKIVKLAEQTDYLLLRKKIKNTLGFIPEKQTSQWYLNIADLLDETLKKAS